MTFAWPRCRRSPPKTRAPPSSALPDSALDPLLDPVPIPRSLLPTRAAGPAADLVGPSAPGGGHRHGAPCGTGTGSGAGPCRSEEHTSELQSHVNLVCRLLLEK